ncbi:MAG: N-acetylmuramoyl-L-alanine amidase [Ignavibacteria bacterium]
MRFDFFSYVQTMKFRSLFFLLFIAFSTGHAQSLNVNVIYNRYSGLVSSLNRRGVDFISVRELSGIISAGVYYNASNAKMEIKLPGWYLKLTSQNEFVVLTSRAENFPKVYQMPLAPVTINEDLYIPIEFFTEILASVLQKSVEYIKADRKLLIDPDRLLISRSKPPEEIRTKEKAGAQNDSVNAKEKTKEITGLVKPHEPVDSAIATPGKKTEAKLKSAVTASKFDIPGITIESKANGTLIRVICKKKAGKYSLQTDKGTLYLNLLNINLDEELVNACPVKGLISGITAKNIGKNSRIAFAMEEGYSKYESFQESPGGDIIISIHNKLLVNFTGSKAKDKWTLKTVVIDAGHGGKDPGAIGVTSVKEKVVNLGIALKLGRIIQENMPDVKVIYTRSNDKFVELYKRGKIANEKNGNLFVSIHCNSTPIKPTNTSGFEIYLLRPGRTKEAVAIAERENSVIQYEDNPGHYQKLTDDNFILVSMAHSAFMRYSERFSDILNKQFTKELSLRSNGIKQAGFYVLVGASMPSILVESGFLSNKKDEIYLNSNTGQDNIAESIFKAIETFKEEYDKNPEL